MTSQQPLIVEAQPNTRLGQLHAQYDAAKAAADEADARLKAVVDAIKVELTQAAPGETKVDLTGPGGTPLRLSYVESWRVDTKRLKVEDPNTYVRYATKSGAWKLQRVSS